MDRVVSLSTVLEENLKMLHIITGGQHYKNGINVNFEVISDKFHMYRM